MTIGALSVIVQSFAKKADSAMFTLTLPDGKAVQFDAPLPLAEAAGKISRDLGKKALAAVVDGAAADLSAMIDPPLTL